mmetsp:Transcript_4286/g.18288  ORF Transcript_4286/g.18288 Transcript_4286/m.18288 type:complete len:186 (+) Transcript_4286:138-695(+)
MVAKIPESQAKKAKRDTALADAVKAALKEKKAKRKATRKEIKARGLKYAEEYAAANQAVIDATKKARSEGKFFVPEGPKVVFAVRIRGINGVAPKERKILQLLRLRQIHNGVFIKLNYATLRMLQRVEHYIAYGYPSLKLVKALIYKRGFGKVGKPGAWSRIPLSDNRVIEASLGKFDILCVSLS